MHKDHSGTSSDQYRGSEHTPNTATTSASSFVFRVQGASLSSWCKIQSTIDSKKMVVYVLSADIVTVIDADGDFLDLTDLGHGGVIQGEDNYTIIMEVIGETRMKIVLQLQDVLTQKPTSPPPSVGIISKVAIFIHTSCIDKRSHVHVCLFLEL